MRKVLTAALLSMIATAILSVAQAARAETSTAQSNSGSKKTAILSAADVVLTETNIPLRARGRLTDIDSPQTFVARHNVAGTNGVFTIDSSGAWNYVTNSALDELEGGQSVSDIFTVSSADGTTTAVKITIVGTTTRRS